jgi:hypothetical protein
MGKLRTEARTPLAWQASLGGMKREGARLAMSCNAKACGAWLTLDLDEMIREHGADWSAWDRLNDPCPRCGGRKTHYLGSAGSATPFRPLRSGPMTEADRRAFLRSFGFTKRDVLRIRALAEGLPDAKMGAELDDLDVPFRVAAVKPNHARNFSGIPLGEWAGRTLIYWEMVDIEREVWERNRRRGPKAVK